MSNYKEMYLTLFRASEEVVNMIIEAQQKAEEIYINSPEPEIIVIPPKKNEK